jgi:hypothetical protein
MAVMAARDTVLSPNLVMAVTAAKDTAGMEHLLHQAVLNGVKVHHHLLLVDMVVQDTEDSRLTHHMVDLTDIMDRREDRKGGRRPVGTSSPEEIIGGRNGWIEN